jgi:hypothetical protein
MKFKFPILIAAGLLIATVSKAQYGGGYANSHVVIQGQINIPGPAYVGYGYNNIDRRDNREGNYGRYDDRRDWRGDEYERYCRDHREYRGDRRAYYREHYTYRSVPSCAPRRVVVYGY